MQDSFAHRHRHLAEGFRAVALWLTTGRWWHLRTPENRAVLHGLLMSLKTEPEHYRKYDLKVGRGEIITTEQELAAWAGFGGGLRHPAKNLLKLAADAKIISRQTEYARGAGDSHTQHLTRLTWIDFDAIDDPDRWQPRRKTGFASDHHEPSGFTCWPRWIFKTAFWQELEPRCRVVVIALYGRLSSAATTHPGTGSSILAGEWIMTIQQIARDSGCGKDTESVRATIAALSAAGIAEFSELAGGHLLIHWHDFHLYNLANQFVHPLSHPVSQPLVHPTSQPTVPPLSQRIDKSYRSENYRPDDLQESPTGRPQVSKAPGKPVQDFTGALTAGAAPASPAERVELADRRIAELGDRHRWWASGTEGPGSTANGIALPVQGPSIPQLVAYWLANVLAVQAREGMPVVTTTDDEWGRACGIVKSLLAKGEDADQLAARIGVTFGEFFDLHDDRTDPASLTVLTNPSKAVALRLNAPRQWAVAVEVAEAMMDFFDELGVEHRDVDAVAVAARMNEAGVAAAAVLKTLALARQHTDALQDHWNSPSRARPYEFLADDRLLMPKPWGILCEHVGVVVNADHITDQWTNGPSSTPAATVDYAAGVRTPIAPDEEDEIDEWHPAGYHCGAK